MCKSLCPLATPMDEPSYENEEQKIRVIDVIDREQPSSVYISHRRRSSKSPPVDNGHSQSTDDGFDQNYCYDDDDGRISVDKRLSPDGASTNNADEPSDDVKPKSHNGIDERLTGVSDVENGEMENNYRSSLTAPVKNSAYCARETPDGADDDDKRNRDSNSDDDIDVLHLNGRANGEAWVEVEPRLDDGQPSVIVTTVDAVVDASTSAQSVNERVTSNGLEGTESEDGDQPTPIFGLGTDDDDQQSLTDDFHGLDLYDNDEK